MGEAEDPAVWLVGGVERYKQAAPRTAREASPGLMESQIHGGFSRPCMTEEVVCSVIIERHSHTHLKRHTHCFSHCLFLPVCISGIHSLSLILLHYIADTLGLFQWLSLFYGHMVTMHFSPIIFCPLSGPATLIYLCLTMETQIKSG